MSKWRFVPAEPGDFPVVGYKVPMEPDPEDGAPSWAYVEDDPVGGVGTRVNIIDSNNPDWAGKTFVIDRIEDGVAYLNEDDPS